LQQKKIALNTKSKKEGSLLTKIAKAAQQKYIAKLTFKLT